LEAVSSRAAPAKSITTHGFELVLFAIGAAAACVWLQSMFDWKAVAGAALVLTGLRAASVFASGGGRTAARVVLGLFHALWIYLALIFGWLLGWTVDPPVVAGVVALAAIAAACRLRPATAFKLPISLPLGIWIFACLLGWLRQDGLIDCNDYDRFRWNGATSLVVPSSTALESCEPGKTLRLAWYPRRVWQAPDRSRYIVTAQNGINLLGEGTMVPDPIEDGVCEFAADGSRTRCVGGTEHKMQAILDAEPIDRVLVAGYSGGHGVVYSLPRSAPLEIVTRAETVGGTGSAFYDPSTGEIGLLADECTQLSRLRADDLSPLEPAPAPFCPGEIHYDAAHGEGIFCFAPGPLGPKVNDVGRPYLSVAFATDPFRYRLLGSGTLDYWTYAALVWGCDFDPESRKAWTAIANLGLIVESDYDDGQVTGAWFAEPGLRSAIYDRERHILYATNFFRGEVVAYDAATGEERGRWFVGRFARYVAFDRNSDFLLATSNLGVVRVEIGIPRSPQTEAVAEQPLTAELCSMAIDAADAGAAPPDGSAALASVVRPIYECRMVERDAKELCDHVEPKLRRNCTARWMFHHAARRAPADADWPAMLAKGLHEDCMSADRGAATPICDQIEAAVRLQKPDQCPPQPEAIHRMCVGLASSDPDRCPAESPDCKELALRLSLLAEGGLPVVAERGTERDRIHARAALGQPGACDPVIEKARNDCAAVLDEPNAAAR